MDKDGLLKTAKKLAKRFRIVDGKGFRLKDHDPGETLDFGAEDKAKAREAVAAGIEVLADMQEKLYAEDRWALLVIFQAMDAAGKDSAIKHVMSGVNPQGCEVYPFKAPSGEELDHEYLWRYVKRLPRRGRIGIFNRSYYEETLVVRVHPELLEAEKVPPELISKNIWKERHRDMRRLESYLARNGIAPLKFFLHLSKEEQKKRFLKRLEDPEKNWKFSANDIRERRYWDDYMDAYEDAIRRTAAKHAPWYVVPADHKWFTRIVVAAAIVDELVSIDPKYPKVTGDKIKEFEEAKRMLLAEKE
jgi:PPK2 family polyphosphate:nucleotide phosphotransferase